MNPVNWVFLPGGLGLGSEYYSSLINQLEMEGSYYRLDFPEDGSNRFEETLSFDALWQEGLVDALVGLEPVILVTHSVSGMLALTMPELESCLSALLVISSAPSDQWRSGVNQRAEGYHLPDISMLNEVYAAEKNDASFKQFFLSLLPYYVLSSSLSMAYALFEGLPYHFKRYEWLQQHFHAGYQANWVPQKLKTLILGSSADLVTPIGLFQDEQRFHRDNIAMVDIPNAGHFPWIEQPYMFQEQLKVFWRRCCC